MIALVVSRRSFAVLLAEFMYYLSYRRPLTVVERARLCSSYYAVCPRCGITLERDYMSFCDRCGQHLDWNMFDKAKKIDY